MIDDIFTPVDHSVGKSSYADDGALWVRGRNIVYVSQKTPAAVDEEEKWTNNGG